MDFKPGENQQAIIDLTDQILSDKISPENLRSMEVDIEEGILLDIKEQEAKGSTGDSENNEANSWFNHDTYGELAKAGLVGIATGEDVGGGGLGLMEVGLVLEVQGQHVAPLPLWNCMLASLAIDRFAEDEVRKSQLPDIISGEIIVALGIQEWHNDDYLSPTTEATPSKEGGDTYKITGTKIVVEFAKEADKMLVVAELPKGSSSGAENNKADGRSEYGNAGLFLVDLNQAGISTTAGVSTRLQPIHEVVMTGVSATVITTDAAKAHWFVNSATTLLCATQAGVTSQALKMSAEYTSSREQFGRPIATFQAVTHRLADQYINVNGIKLTAYAALWDLDKQLEDMADTQRSNLATMRACEAKWYASHLAMQIADATQHVHGGIGVDKDYPLHRYTLWNKHIQTSLGAGTQQLRRLGALLASGS